MKTNLINKIRHYLIIFIICALVSLFTGCGANEGGASDSNQPQNKPTINDEMTPIIHITYGYEQYQIFKISNVSFIKSLGDTELTGIIYYVNEYVAGEGVDKYDNWLVNYRLNDNNIDPSGSYNKELIELIYDELRPTIEAYQTEFDTKFEFYEGLYNIEKEFKVQTNKNFDSVITVDAYLPFVVLNTKTNDSNYIYVPIKSLLGYCLGNNIELICDNLILDIEYNEFMSIEGIQK